MLFRTLCGVVLSALLLPAASFAQAPSKDKVKEKVAAGACGCIDKKMAARNTATSLGKDEASQMLSQCLMAAAGKDLSAIQAAYGTNSFNNPDVMRQMGQEVAGVMMQNCANFTTLSLAMAGSAPAATSSTTGQTSGQLGNLQSSGVLEVQVSKIEKAEFAWLHRFAQADEILSQLGKLQGRQVRVSWQEVEIFQPGTQQYRKVREITGIELM